MNLPNDPPGANYNKFNLLTWHTSTPGTFLKAYLNLAFSLEYTTNGPFLNLYLLFLAFPYPALKVVFSITFSTSSKAPTFLKNLIAYFVFSYDSILSSTTNGNSYTLLNL